MTSDFGRPLPGLRAPVRCTNKHYRVAINSNKYSTFHLRAEALILSPPLNTGWIRGGGLCVFYIKHRLDWGGGGLCVFYINVQRSDTLVRRFHAGVDLVVC